MLSVTSSSQRFHASLKSRHEIQILQLKRLAACLAFLGISPFLSATFQSWIRTEVSFSQKFPPSVDTLHKTTVKVNTRKWSKTSFHLCGIDKPLEWTLQLEACLFIPLEVLPLKRIWYLSLSILVVKTISVFPNWYVSGSYNCTFFIVFTLTFSKAGPYSLHT